MSLAGLQCDLILFIGLVARRGGGDRSQGGMCFLARQKPLCCPQARGPVLAFNRKEQATSAGPENPGKSEDSRFQVPQSGS